MARLVPIALLIALPAVPALGQPSADNRTSALLRPWQTRIAEEPSPSFSLVTQESLESDYRESNIWAGTQLSPEASFGLGLYGPKRDWATQAPVTVRDHGLPRTRHKGIGLTLKF